MASSNHLTRLKNLRDNLESELENETARRLSLTAAGHPPPANYSVSGKSVSWTDYLEKMLKSLKELNDQILAAGAEEGGIPEANVRLF
jgi:hypothetical protein